MFLANEIAAFLNNYFSGTKWWNNLSFYMQLQMLEN